MPNIFEVNAAIEEVIASNGNNQAAAAIVIQYAQSLPETTVMKEKRTNWGKKKGGILRGFTNEAGNVTLKDEDGQEKKKEWLADGKARVGHFRLWRALDQVFFHHYWASDLTTGNLLEDGLPETFVLKYDSEIGKMESLGKIAYDAEWHRSGLFTRRKEIFLVLLDREHEGQRRPFGEFKSSLIQISLTVEDVARFKRYTETPKGKVVLFALAIVVGAILAVLIVTVGLVVWVLGRAG